MDDILQKSKSLNSNIIKLRRLLHEYPEYGSDLPITRKIITNRLEELGVPYKLNSLDSGIVAEIISQNATKTIAFRADMDALNLTEETGLSFSSKREGKFHGCGHDAHVAVLLVVAELLVKNASQLKCNVRLLFQAGEETGTGALNMIKEGAIDGVSEIYSLHVGNLAGDLEVGSLLIKEGAVSAGKDKFSITVNGKATHSAFPQNGIDSIFVAGRIISSCNEFMNSAEMKDSAAVLSFGSVNAGFDHNTIPAVATLKGSIRVQDVELRNYIGKRLIEICESESTKIGATCVVDIKRGSQTIYNDPNLCNEFVGALGEGLKDLVLTKSKINLMGSDDFANYLKYIKGVYFFLSTNNSNKGIVEMNHNPRFDIDESVLWEGVYAYASIALK